jgi:hypothetical protein
MKKAQYLRVLGLAACQGKALASEVSNHQWTRPEPLPKLVVVLVVVVLDTVAVRKVLAATAATGTGHEAITLVCRSVRRRPRSLNTRDWPVPRGSRTGVVEIRKSDNCDSTPAERTLICRKRLKVAEPERASRELWHPLQVLMANLCIKSPTFAAVPSANLAPAGTTSPVVFQMGTLFKDEPAVKGVPPEATATPLGSS